jgi:hypothetical protein
VKSTRKPSISGRLSPSVIYSGDQERVGLQLQIRCRLLLYLNNSIVQLVLHGVGCCLQIIMIIIIISWVRLSLLVLRPIGLLYQPQMIGDDDCGEIGGMKISRGNRTTRRKPTPAPLCPPQIPHD